MASRTCCSSARGVRTRVMPKRSRRSPHSPRRVTHMCCALPVPTTRGCSSGCRTYSRARRVPTGWNCSATSRPSPRCTAVRARSCSRVGPKDSACRSSRRWPAAPRSWRSPTPRRPRSRGTPPRWCPTATSPQWCAVSDVCSTSRPSPLSCGPRDCGRRPASTGATPRTATSRSSSTRREADVVRVAVDGLLASHPEAAGRGLGRYVDALLTDLPLVPGVELTALGEFHRVNPHIRLEWYEHILRIGFDARRMGADVFHSPGLDPPVWYRGPWVQTLHDVTPLAFPSEDWGVEPFRWRVRGALMRRANAVICISQHTADLGVRHLGLRPERLHVIHHGAAPVFHEPVAPFLADRPYVLMVSGFGPHKGFAEAFDVIGRLADAGLAHELRVVGEYSTTQMTRVEQLRAAARHPDRIRLEGRLDDLELASRYRGTDGLMVTSRYEGFGLPALE